MKCAVVTTTNPDIASALDGLVERLRDGLGGARPDLLMAWFTPHHAADAPLIRERLLEQLDPAVLMGCPALGVLGETVEIESGSGVALWGASWPGVELHPFHLSMGEADVPEVTGWPDDLPEGAGVLILADPYTTPPDDLLRGFDERYPGRAVLGGMASGSSGPGEANLISRDGVHDEGTLAVAVSGSVRVDPVVSQGCRPVGSHLVVTKADRNAILALGGLTDPRVTYWEPAKDVAKVRTLKTDDEPLLLKINMGAGHGGQSGRFNALRETAEEYAFVLTSLGIADPNQ